MNVHRNFVRLFVLALAATALSVGTSSAQDFQGKFTLNHQAQWGQAVLQPGSYTLTLSRFQGGQRMVEVRRDAKGGAETTILPASENASRANGKSDLICIRQGGTLVIRALEVGPAGETVYFHAPKNVTIEAQRRGSEQPVLLAMAPQLIERVPLELGAK